MKFLLQFQVRARRNFDLDGMMGRWYVIQYYASTEELPEYACMRSHFTFSTEDQHVSRVRRSTSSQAFHILLQTISDDKEAELSPAIAQPKNKYNGPTGFFRQIPKFPNSQIHKFTNSQIQKFQILQRGKSFPCYDRTPDNNFHLPNRHPPPIERERERKRERARIPKISQTSKLSEPNKLRDNNQY